MKGQYFSFDVLTAVLIFLIISSLFLVFFLFQSGQNTIREELRTQIALEVSNSILSPGDYSLYSPDGTPRVIVSSLLLSLSDHYSRIYSREISISVEPAGFHGCPAFSSPLPTAGSYSKIERISLVKYRLDSCNCEYCSGEVIVPALISVYVS